jgi:tetratricopeptide (TPR) repeat protein
MWEIIIFAVSLLLLGVVFVHRWYLLEKGQLFGKMVLKRGMNLPSKLTKEDHEVTVKEMIPKADTIDPKLAVKGDVLFKKAELALKKGDLDGAEKLFIQSISMNPSKVETHARLGSIYLNDQSYSKAELIYRKLIITDPDNPTYYSNLGLALFQQEKFEDARAFYEKAIELDDQRPGRFYSLSRINYQLGDFDNAILNIQKAITLDPENLDYGLTLSHWYFEKNMNTEAKEILEKILKHWPESEEALAMMKDIKGGDENLEKAIEDEQK